MSEEFIESVKEPQTDENTTPLEVINFTAKYENVLALQKYIYRDLIKACLLFGTILLALFAVLRFLTTVTTTVLLVGAVLMLFYALLLEFSARSNAKRNFEQSKNSVETWYVYGDHIEFRIERDRVQQLSYRINAKEILEVAVLKNLYVFKYDKMAFGVQKDDVKEGSVLFKLLFPSGVAKDSKPKNTMANCYMLLVFITVFYTYACIYAVGNNTALWWMLLIGIPLSVGCFVLSGFAKVKGIKIKGSVICNIVVAILLAFFIIASLATAFANVLEDFSEDFVYTDGESNTLSSALAAADLEIPYKNQKSFYSYKIYDEDSARYVDVGNTTFYLEGDALESFCDYVESDDKWLTSLDNDTEEFFAPYLDCSPGDVMFVYNLTEDTYNSLPTSESECGYLVVIFSSRYEYIDIYEFAK